MAAKKKGARPAKSAHARALAQAEQARKRSLAAKKGWKKKKAKEAAKEERRGFEVVALSLAIFRPSRGKHKDRWDGIPVLKRVLRRLESSFERLESEFPGFAGAFAPAFIRGAWRAEIPFARGLTYSEVQGALDSVDASNIPLDGGRLHIAMILREHGYVPLSNASESVEVVLADASDSLAQGAQKYAPAPSIDDDDIDEMVESEIGRESDRARKARLAFKRNQERQKMLKRRAKR